MDKLKTRIDSETHQKLLDGNVTSLFHILTAPLSELLRVTNLPAELLNDIKRNAGEIALTSKFLTADKIPSWERLSTGCSSIDTILKGGVPINGVVEIFGSSGVGKTQLCLQLGLTIQLPTTLGGKGKEAVYIGTEDVFPSKRLHQLATTFKAKYNLPHLDFESQLYLEYAEDFEQLRQCLCVRLPKLLSARNVGLLIIDSIAGIFRSENSDVCYTRRGQDIGVIASTLHNLHDEYNIGIVCVNQVADNLTTKTPDPCLGLAWSNNVTCRFSLSRHNGSLSREFEVVFAPDLPTCKCLFAITNDGIVNVS